MDAVAGQLTLLLKELSRGNPNANDRLIPLVYSELRKLAARYIRGERSGHTLQATALVHEACLRLVDQKSVEWQDRVRFFATAAQTMRRVLIHHARQWQAEKRGGPDQVKVALDEGMAFSEDRSAELIAVDRALVRLAGIGVTDTRQAVQAAAQSILADRSFCKPSESAPATPVKPTASSFRNDPTASSFCKSAPAAASSFRNQPTGSSFCKPAKAAPATSTHATRKSPPAVRFVIRQPHPATLSAPEHRRIDLNLAARGGGRKRQPLVAANIQFPRRAGK